MNTNQIISCVWCVGAEVTAADEIGLPKKFPAFLIINTEPKNLRDGHWVGAVIKNAIGGVEINYFDSLGLPVCSKHIIKAFNKLNPTKIIRNRFQIQDSTSEYCALYAIAFIFYLYKGGGIESFCSQFTADLKANDLLIQSLFSASMTEVGERGCDYISKLPWLNDINNASHTHVSPE